LIKYIDNKKEKKMKKNFFSTNRTENFNSYFETIKGGGKIEQKEYSVSFPRDTNGYFFIIKNSSDFICATILINQDKIFWVDRDNKKIEYSEVAAWKKFKSFQEMVEAFPFDEKEAKMMSRQEQNRAKYLFSNK
jgi:hypothetical protein